MHHISGPAHDVSEKKRKKHYKSIVSSTVPREKLDSFGVAKLINDQYSHHIEISQLIFRKTVIILFVTGLQ